MIAFTICAKNYLAKALVLRESFLAHHPHDNFLIVIADAISNPEECKLISDALDGVSAVFFQEIRNKIDFPRLEELLVKYDVTEFCTAIKPFVFQYLLEWGYSDIVYLDPDIVVYHHFDVLRMFLEKYDIALTPHALRPKPKAEDDTTFLSSGAYNLGFLAMRRSESADELLSWWGECLLDHCYKEPRPFFTDQKWADLFPSMFNGVGILKHPGYNVARWNLHERTFTVRDDKWYVNGEYPLVFYHFSEDKKNGVQSAPLGLFSEYYTNLAKKLNTELTGLARYYDKVPGTDISIASWRKRQQAGHGTTADYQILRPDNRFLEAYTGRVQDRAFGLNIVGWLRHPNSVGQVARDFVQGLLSAGIPFAWTPLDECEPGVPLGGLGQLEYYRSNDPIFDTTVYFVNADRIKEIISRYPNLRGQRNVGVYWWELESKFPFVDAFDYVDRVLTFSNFVHKTMELYAPDRVKLHQLLYPLRLGPVWNMEKTREEMGAKPDDCVFGFSFDYNSDVERKNPFGLIAAFSMAFDKNDKVFLLIKATNADERQAAVLAKAAGNSHMKDRIRLVYQTLPRPMHLGLMNACDCYISLHRSEGLGLGMMEAMAMGKPVIATGYSGNLQFMSETNSYLVRWNPGKVTEAFKNYYPVGAAWAEPDCAVAAEQMRRVYKNRDEAIKRGKAGQRSLDPFTNPSIFRHEILSLINSFATS